MQSLGFIKIEVGRGEAAPKLLHFVAWKGSINLFFVDSFFLLTVCSFPMH